MRVPSSHSRHTKEAREKVSIFNVPATVRRGPHLRGGGGGSGPQHPQVPRTGRERAMKLVVAIIKPHQVEAVTGALDTIEVSGMTLTEVRGHGRQRGHSEVYRGGEYKVDFLPKVRIEVLATDGQAEQVANTIVDNART